MPLRNSHIAAGEKEAFDMSKRFLDTGQDPYDGTLFLVRCSRCGRCATVTPRDLAQQGIWAPRRFACHHCGHARDWPPPPLEDVFLRDGEWCVRPRHRMPGITIGSPRDWYFDLPLWLQAPCCGQVLWAYHAWHLTYLEEYIGATLRERRPEVYRSLAARLPSWMKTAKHRDEVLQALARLRARLLEGGEDSPRPSPARPPVPTRYPIFRAKP
jgi:hypothetical protein